MDVRRRIELVGYHIERLGELVEELEQEDEEKIMIELSGGIFGGYRKYNLKEILWYIQEVLGKKK